MSEKVEKISFETHVEEASSSDSTGEIEELDEATSRRLLRKTDLYLCPLMMLVYAVQFMDKSTNSSASIMGLRTDLHMVSNDFAWTGTSFYLGYLVFEFPAVYLMQKFPLPKTLSFFVILWGIVLCLHATPNYAGFVALRTILGMLESAVTPAFVIITSQWYKKEEQFLRTCIWFGSNGLGTIIGSLMAYGLATNNSLPIKGWELVFIITGVITIAVGIAIYFHIPENPSQAWFLTELERKQVALRVRSNQQGFSNSKTFKKDQFIEAFTDVRSWIYFFYSLCSNIPNGGLTNFTSILLSETLGLGPLRGLLLQTPQGAVELVGCIALGLVAEYSGRRTLAALSALAIAIVAVCLLAFMPHNQGAGLAGLYLNVISPVGFIAMLSSVASNTAGHSKKATVNAILLVGYCVGNVIGAQTFRAKDAPEYVPAKVVIVVMNCISILMTLLLMFVNVRENKKRDKEGIKDATPEQLAEIQSQDLTDKQNRFFRYAV